MLASVYKSPLVFMVSHALLAAAWNGTGLWLVSQGQSPLGPTASGAAVALMAVLIVLYVFTFKKGYEKTFLLIASVGALLGILTIYGALTKDHSLWPSEFWRYAGIAVNALAAIGFALGIKGYISSKGNH